jgi:hypothetical protein
MTADSSAPAVLFLAPATTDEAEPPAMIPADGPGGARHRLDPFAVSLSTGSAPGGTDTEAAVG